MLPVPVCSAAPSCSFRSQISFHLGVRQLFPLRKDFQVDFSAQGFVYSGLNHVQRASLKPYASKSLYSNLVGATDNLASSFSANGCSFLNNLYYTPGKHFDSWSSPNREISGMHDTRGGLLKYIESSSVDVVVEDGLQDFGDASNSTPNLLSPPLEPENLSNVEIVMGSSNPASDLRDKSDSASASMKSSIEDLIAQLKESINSTIGDGENTFKSSFDAANSSLTVLKKSVTEEVDNVISGLFNTIDKSGEKAGTGLTSFSSDLKDATSKASVVAVDLLRHSIVAVEDSLTKGTSFVFYVYGSAKELLPSEVKDVLSMSEEIGMKFFSPIRTTLQEVNASIENLERGLGLDPNDPIIPFVLFLGTSATLWVAYWVRTYGGYSGDLSSSSALDILMGRQNAVLIDVRPEALREKDGIPDLRRAARFRYASVALPEVNSSVRKLLKGGRDLDDALTAAVIRNLKIVQDRSKVIIMDANGSHSKRIARSLRRQGVKKSFIVKCGFHSWMKEGLRIKELKPETALTILNEEAEAILEDINPSPVQLIGYGVGLLAALYALVEWEKTLQLIGVVGIGQTIYRRVVTYEDAEDFKEDLRLLIAPVRVGAQAFSWTAGKLETNGVKLPTSPSSTDVQNRVLQAAAKHESQPTDGEDQSSESTASSNKNIDS